MPSKLLSLSLLLLLLTLTTQAEKTFKLTRHQTNSASSILKKIESLGESSKRDLNLNGATSHGLGYTIDVSLGGGPAIPVIVSDCLKTWHEEQPPPGRRGLQELWTDLRYVSLPRLGPDYHPAGIGSVQGCVSVTTMKVEEFEIDNLHVLAAKSVGADMRWQGAFMSGLWGMARDGATVDGAPTAVSLMYSQKLIKTPTVGFYLGRESDGAESEMTIGDVSSLRYTQTDKKATVKSQPNTYALYAVKVDSITVNGKEMGKDILAYIDTGSTAISTPEPMIGEIYNALFGDVAYQYQKSYIVPCEPLSNASIAFNFGGVSFNMSPVDLV
nr:hypothetical protein L204_00550 [Cryptococcus depauperatus CBS 7855]